MHQSLFSQCQGDYSLYQKELKSYCTHLYALPMGHLLRQATQPQGLSLGSLAIHDNIEEELPEQPPLRFPSLPAFLTSIVHSYREQRLNEAMSQRFGAEVEQEMDYLVLLNALFGHPHVDLQHTLKELGQGSFRETLFQASLSKCKSSDPRVVDKHVLFYLSKFIRKLAQEIGGRKSLEGRSLEYQLLSHMSTNNLVSACRLARENQLANLGLLISGSQNKSQRALVQEQMGDFAGVTQYSLVYKALGGDMTAFSGLDEVTWV